MRATHLHELYLRGLRAVGARWRDRLDVEVTLTPEGAVFEFQGSIARISQIRPHPERGCDHRWGEGLIRLPDNTFTVPCALCGALKSDHTPAVDSVYRERRLSGAPAGGQGGEEGIEPECGSADNPGGSQSVD